MINQLKLLQKITWNEVFQTWEHNENGPEHRWDQFAQEVKGWPNWKAWREYQWALLGLPKREWQVYEIPEPKKLIPEIKLGPTQGWQSNFPESEALTHTFADVARDKTKWAQQNNSITEIKSPFTLTQLTGLYIPEEDVIYLIEGHHRCAKIALQVFLEQPMEFIDNPHIALATMHSHEKGVLFETLQRGSVNPEKK